MTKQEYIAPRAELIVVKAQLMDTFASGARNDGEHIADVVDDDSDWKWGDND